MIKIAQAISFFLHPVIFFLLMPFIIINKLTSSPLYALKWEIFSSGFILLGALIFLIAKKKGFYSDADISKREERHSFYVITWILSLIYLGSSLLIKGIFFPLSIIAIGIAMGIIVFDLTNFYIKASVHSMAVWAFVLTILVLYGEKSLFFTFWTIPLIYWSRYKLKRHTIPELIAGSLLGILITLVTLAVGKFLYYG